jgi:hypothetical protein
LVEQWLWETVILCGSPISLPMSFRQVEVAGFTYSWHFSTYTQLSGLDYKIGQCSLRNLTANALESNALTVYFHAIFTLLSSAGGKVSQCCFILTGNSKDDVSSFSFFSTLEDKPNLSELYEEGTVKEKKIEIEQEKTKLVRSCCL